MSAEQFATLPELYQHMVAVHKHVDHYPSMTRASIERTHDQLHKEAGQ